MGGLILYLYTKNNTNMYRSIGDYKSRIKAVFKVNLIHKQRDYEKGNIVKRNYSFLIFLFFIMNVSLSKNIHVNFNMKTYLIYFL